MNLPDLPKRNVYLDHAAATPAAPEVLLAMQPYWTDDFANAGGLYASGRRAAAAVEKARQVIAQILAAQADEIIFVGSGTESDNLAIFGVAKNHTHIGKHLITTNIEHHAVGEPLVALQKEGWEITEVPVEKNGIVDAQKIAAAIRPDTTLISVMYANNEIGTIQPLAAIGAAVRRWKKENGRQENEAPFLHTDACQAAGVLTLNIADLKIDLLTLNGAKIYGPKGCGLLWVRRGLKLQPQILGGGQENNRRSGTENVPAIVGLATALKLAQDLAPAENARQTKLRNDLLAGIQAKIPKTVLNGDADQRLPNNLNVSILDIEGESVLLYLDELGVQISTGSACTSRSLDPSHVIMALGHPPEFAHGSLRFTLGRGTTAADIAHVLQVLPPLVEWLRQISPINIQYGPIN